MELGFLTKLQYQLTEFKKSVIIILETLPNGSFFFLVSGWLSSSTKNWKLHVILHLTSKY